MKTHHSFFILGVNRIISLKAILKMWLVRKDLKQLWILAWVYGAKTVKHHCRKSDSTWIGTCYVDCDCGGGCASCQTGSQRSLSGTAPGWDGAVPVGSEANLTNDTYQSWNHGIRWSHAYAHPNIHLRISSTMCSYLIPHVACSALH